MSIQRQRLGRSVVSAVALCVAAVGAAHAATPVAITTSTDAGGGSADVIAHGGAADLGSADIRALVANLPSSQRAAVTGDLKNLEQVIRAELVRRAVLAEIKSKDFEHQANTAVQLDKVRDEALVRLWIASQATVPAGYPSEDDIKTAYEANKAALTAPTEYRVGQIFISAPDGCDPAKLNAALQKATLIEGKIGKSDFSELAQQQSEHAESASKGGDLGYLPENRMMPEIASVIRTMKGGDVVGPIKTAQGLHFIKLLDKKTGTVPTLAQVHDQLASAMRSRREGELERAYLTTLNDKLGVTVNQIQLAKLQQSLK